MTTIKVTSAAQAIADLTVVLGLSSSSETHGAL
jgi:hypothetical protein